VTGASGAVGGFAVQLAAARGIPVVAVASYGDDERVRALGASEVLPRTEDLVAAVRRLAPDGIDAVLDAVPVGPQLIGAVRDGGTFVTVVDPAVPAAERGVRVAKVSVRPDAGQLAELLADLAAGRLATAVARRMPLTEAGTALKLAAGGGLRGKVVLVP
jgi:NADPH:quinone reductase-like Zn-dependent oxidoreductase